MRVRSILSVGLAVLVSLAAGCAGEGQKAAPRPSASATASPKPSAKPTATPTPSCPPVDQVAKAVQEQNGVWQAGDTVPPDSVVCAGPFVVVAVLSQVDDGQGNKVEQGYRVLLRQTGSGLKWLKNGSAPLCTTNPNSSGGEIYVAPQYATALGCIHN